MAYLGLVKDGGDDRVGAGEHNCLEVAEQEVVVLVHKPVDRVPGAPCIVVVANEILIIANGSVNNS